MQQDNSVGVGVARSGANDEWRGNHFSTEEGNLMFDAEAVETLSL